MTTSAAKSGEEGLASLSMEEEEKVAFGNGPEPSSSEGAGIMRVALQSEAPEGFQEGGTPDCSSSHQVKYWKNKCSGFFCDWIKTPFIFRQL